MLKATQIPSNV